jgi:hypothetical protein
MLCGHCEFDNLPLQPRCWLASLANMARGKVSSFNYARTPINRTRYGRPSNFAMRSFMRAPESASQIHFAESSFF